MPAMNDVFLRVVVVVVVGVVAHCKVTRSPTRKTHIYACKIFNLWLSIFVVVCRPHFFLLLLLLLLVYFSSHLLCSSCYSCYIYFFLFLFLGCSVYYYCLYVYLIATSYCCYSACRACRVIVVARIVQLVRRRRRETRKWRRWIRCRWIISLSQMLSNAPSSHATQHTWSNKIATSLLESFDLNSSNDCLLFQHHIHICFLFLSLSLSFVFTFFRLLDNKNVKTQLQLMLGIDDDDDDDWRISTSMTNKQYYA